MNIKADDSHFGLWRVSIFTIRRLITFYYRPYDEHFSARVKLAFLFSIFSKLLLPAADWLKPDIILYILASQNYNTIWNINVEYYKIIYISQTNVYIYFNNFFPCPIFSRFFYTSDPRFILLARTAINANRSIRARRHLDVVVVDVIAFFTMSRLVAYTQRSRDQTSTRSFPTSRTYPQSSTASGIIISIFPGGRRFEANETKWNEFEAIALRCWRRGRGRGGGLS